MQIGLLIQLVKFFDVIRAHNLHLLPCEIQFRTCCLACRQFVPFTKLLSTYFHSPTPFLPHIYQNMSINVFFYNSLKLKNRIITCVVNPRFCLSSITVLDILIGTMGVLSEYINMTLVPSFIIGKFSYTRMVILQTGEGKLKDCVGYY